ncbi:hypothetical protein QWY90_09920 [Flavobacterium paronense]|uniref:Uncharacterized protein n=1 Tax=Flavobacterium paronense TaxID=1392775 RepID=A0ABV5GBR0_9FLAO|nr:hypothetical protein [Flavobacterium paronense]MDN3677632.1 hypothetical protein [Flavobacterium paronense]
MKTLKVIAIVLMLIVTSSITAQVTVNIGARPVWGPAYTTEEYYYLSDIDSYYDIRQSQFIYLNNGTWVRSRALPRRYRNYNLNTGHIVVLNNYHGRSPYTHFKKHKVKFYNNGTHWKGNGDRKENHGNGKGKRNK